MIAGGMQPGCLKEMAEYIVDPNVTSLLTINHCIPLVGQKSQIPISKNKLHESHPISVLGIALIKMYLICRHRRVKTLSQNRYVKVSMT